MENRFALDVPEIETLAEYIAPDLTIVIDKMTDSGAISADLLVQGLCFGIALALQVPSAAHPILQVLRCMQLEPVPMQVSNEQAFIQVMAASVIKLRKANLTGETVQ